MSIRLPSVLLLTVLVAGCAFPAKQAVVQPEAETAVLSELAVYAQRASLSMQRMAAMKNANGSGQVANIVAPAGMNTPMFLNWNGPIEGLVKSIAERTGYSYEGVVGVKPATPVIVSVSVTNMPAFNILVDAGAQAGSAADIVVRPDTKKIFIKFPPVIRSGGYPNAN